MNDFNLSKTDDLTAEPSAELQNRTLAAMRAAEHQKNTKKSRVRTLRRKITVCAALVCTALVLLGAGVRVFDYLTFVPGMGVVTAEQENVYTLEHVVNADGYRIEAVSMIPAEDAEHEGMWQVTVLTDRSVPHDFHENPDSMPKMTLYGKDDEPYTLSCGGGSTVGARYTGYAVIAPGEDIGEYTLNWNGEDCTLSMKSMKNSVWANYNYPVSDGITVITFPLTDGSQYLVFDVIFEPQSENMAFWASHCETIYYTAWNVNITDVEGNAYHVYGQNGRSITVPESELEYGVNTLVEYKMEYILTMDTPLAAEIATIDVGEIAIIFDTIYDTGNYLVEIPKLDETVPAEELPNGGVFLDQHGVRVTFDEMTSSIDKLNKTYDIIFRREGDVEFDFEENVTDTYINLGYIEPERAASAERWEFRGGGQASERSDANNRYTIEYSMPFLGAGDLRDKGLNLTFGDEVLMRLNSLSLKIDGDWHIDFTREKAE